MKEFELLELGWLSRLLKFFEQLHWRCSDEQSLPLYWLLQQPIGPLDLKFPLKSPRFGFNPQSYFDGSDFLVFYSNLLIGGLLGFVDILQILHERLPLLY